MNIGIVTVWFERGASYVSRQYKQLLEADGHNIFIYARGGIYAKDDAHYNTDDVTWGKPGHIPIGGSFDLKHFKTWLLEKKLEVVFFNEQSWLLPVVLCFEMGIKTGAYIDYYTPKTIPFFRIYDFLICNTKRHFSVFKSVDQCFYVPWGTDIELFKPVNEGLVNSNYVTFFHSCGFSPERKGTDILLKAFEGVNHTCKLIIHSQTDLKKKLYSIRELIEKLISEGKLEIINKTIGAPGLYHLGDVYVYPTRLEGIGLTIAEAMACGLPVIVPDNGPMNEFVSTECGSLAKVTRFYRRKDDYFWDMCDTDIKSMTEVIENYAKNASGMRQQKLNARNYAIKNLNWNENRELVNAIFTTTKIYPGIDKTELVTRILNEEYLKTDSFKYKLYKKLPGVFKLLHKLMKL